MHNILEIKFQTRKAFIFEKAIGVVHILQFLNINGLCMYY